MKMDILKCPKQVFASEFGRQKTHIWNLPLIAVEAKHHSAFFSVLEGFFKDKNEKDLGNFYVIHI